MFHNLDWLEIMENKKNKTVDEILSKIKNGREMYDNSPSFNAAFNQLYLGGDPYSILCSLCENIDNLIKVSQEYLEVIPVAVTSVDASFAEWISDNSLKKCVNGEWIKLGTGEYNTVARNTRELLEKYIESKK